MKHILSAGLVYLGQTEFELLVIPEKDLTYESIHQNTSSISKYNIKRKQTKTKSRGYQEIVQSSKRIFNSFSNKQEEFSD